MSTPGFSVFHVDDYSDSCALVRIWLSRLPFCNYLGAAGNLEEGIAACREKQPDLILLDAVLPDGDSLDVIPRFRNGLHSPRILLYTGWDYPAFHVLADSAKIHGILWKSGKEKEFEDAVTRVAGGGTYFSAAYLESAQSHRASDSSLGKILSDAEFKVLRLQGRGHSDSVICQRCGIQAATLATHRRNIRVKLDIHSAADLKQWAIRQGFYFPLVLPEPADCQA